MMGLLLDRRYRPGKEAMNATDYCVVVRLLLLPDRIVVELKQQRVSNHAFIGIDQLDSHRLYYLIKRGKQLEYCLQVTDDRNRYERVLDDLREQIVSNLKGESVLFDLATDPSKPIPWTIDRPEPALV